MIRDDHRDTGRSVTYPPRRPGYIAAGLVADTAGVLDALVAQRDDHWSRPSREIRRSVALAAVLGTLVSRSISGCSAL
jgi:hypothetical protein